MNDIPCAECFHFKTKILTVSNYQQDRFFNDEDEVIKNIFNKGFLRIWYCSKGFKIGGKNNTQYYTTEGRGVNNIKVKKCKLICTE